MADQDFHKLYPEEFERARLMAHGTIIGWCCAKGEARPYLTDVLLQAYNAAFAEAFNEGFRAGREVR